MNVFDKLMSIRDRRLAERQQINLVYKKLRIRFIVGLCSGFVVGVLLIAALSIQTVEVVAPDEGVYKVVSLDICGRFFTLYRSKEFDVAWTQLK